MIGQRLGAYEITAKLGEGGMGEVFRARDSRLNRDVALKVLPADMSSDPERLERFRREAQAVAALNHSNIVTLYSFEESSGVCFLTMELVEGAALDKLIPREGFDLESWLEIGAALADAVAAAHAKGIVHRDLKPANIMIGGGGGAADRRQVKVLDFGLARMTESGTGASAAAPTLLTGDGVVMGTLPYMSPEQVRGVPLDERTDLFSLGVILYEMAAGRRPFDGESSVELGSAILRDAPPPLAGRHEKLPADVERILRRCLEKEPRDRIASARALYDELRLLRRDVVASVKAAPNVAAGDSGAGRAGEGFRVAVLPFQRSGSSVELAGLAEGLAEAIGTGLSRFSYLHVIARSATSRVADPAADIRSAGKELGARYVMEGSIRQAGSKVRLAVQLVDTASGAHLWAETYDRAFDPEAAFELSDDLVPRIVSTVADQNGILTRRMSESLRGKSEDALTPHEAVLRAFSYFERVTPEEHAVVRRILERAVREAPDSADAWAMLSLMYTVEFADDFNPQPDPLGRALAAAQRSVHLAATNALGHYALAFVYFLRKETASFRAEAEKALALNPMDGSIMGILGVLVEHAGESERGCRLAEAAMQLNPNHPGLFRWAAFVSAYNQGRYAEALELAVRINMPNYFYANVARAAALGQLGRREAASTELAELLALRPGFANEARREFSKWYDSGRVERMIEGLRKAGLDIAPAPATGAPAPGSAHSIAPSSGASRVDAGFWVAVLPFKYSGGNADLAALAEGFSEEIVTGLSRFPYLRVIAQGFASPDANRDADVRSAARDSGARYVMEGSIRQAGQRVRFAAQLVDAVSGAHLWAETYDRAFRAEELFELQDDVVPRIVSTCGDRFGVLARAISEAVRARPGAGLTPYESLMRGFGYHFRLSPEEHAEARQVLEQAVEQAPTNPDCWAMLSWVYAHEHAHGFNARPGSLDRALSAARRAVDLAPSNALAQQALAVALFFRKEIAACLTAAERALALNPLDASSESMFLIAFAGDWERGCTLIRKAIDLNPHHPRWYELILGLNEFRLGQYRAAVAELEKAEMGESSWKCALLAAAYGELGERTAASKALRELLALQEGFARDGRAYFENWFDSQLVERLMEGLRKAGLDVPAPARAEPSGERTADVGIAVLPFADMSPTHDQEYLCEGMAEEIMSALVHVDGLRVAARTSAFRAQRDGGDPRAIGERLGVGFILEGSVRTSGARLRATAQLIDVATGFQLWSERYDRDATDVFAVQDEIAASVVDAVKSKLAPGERAVRTRTQAVNLEAYRAHLRGRYLRHTKNDHGGALRAFEEAVRLDPTYAPAWVGVAECTVLASFYGFVGVRDACARARAALATAERLAEESTEALYVRGFIGYLERDWVAWESAYRRALEREPTQVTVLGSFSLVLVARHRIEEALTLLERSRAADPLAAFPYAITGVSLAAVRRFADAERMFEDAFAFESENMLALWGAGVTRSAQGRHAEAIATLEKAVGLSRRAPFFLGLLGWALAVAGRTDEARALADELALRPATEPAIVPESWLLAALGETDAAFAVLARAEEERQAFLLLTGLPGLDPMRADPRFRAMEERLGLKPWPISG